LEDFHTIAIYNHDLKQSKLTVITQAGRKLGVRGPGAQPRTAPETWAGQGVLVHFENLQQLVR